MMPKFDPRARIFEIQDPGQNALGACHFRPIRKVFSSGHLT